MRCTVGALRPKVGAHQRFARQLDDDALEHRFSGFARKGRSRSFLSGLQSLVDVVLHARKGRPEGRPIASDAYAFFGRFFDAFAEGVAHEAVQRDRRADRLFGFLDGLGDRLGGVVHDRADRAGKLPCNRSSGRIRRSFRARAAACRRSCRRAPLFARDDRRVDARGVERKRTRGRDMHRDQPAEGGERARVAGRFQRDDDADAAEASTICAVDIMADRRLGGHAAPRRGARSCSRRSWRWLGDRVGDRAAAGVMRAVERLDVDVGALVERDRERCRARAPGILRCGRRSRSRN